MKLNKSLLPKEKQYSIQFDNILDKGPIFLGPTCSFLWRHDPRHLCFLLSRYKFCSKLLADKKNVLEIGCGDAFGSRLVLQTVSKLHAIDFDPLFISQAKKLYENELDNISFQELDITENPPSSGPFDAVFALDFIEHIHSSSEDAVFNNIKNVLTSNSVAILGTPNITSLPYASKESIEGHINLKSAESLKTLLKKYFREVMIFSMNDEVIHTGFFPMAHYLFGIGINLK